jgi:hypothetical protein
MKLAFTPWSVRLNVIALIGFFGLALGHVSAIDIPALTWTPRSDWINIKTDSRVSPHAVGDGVTDDTAAIQSALDVMNNDIYSTSKKTVYFPAGTYKITSTLHITNLARYNLIGCGINTIIRWYGASGGAMIWPNSVVAARYDGFVWDGNNLAGCAYEEYSGNAQYTTAIRHENESFRNFTVTGSYLTDPYYPSGFPPAAIISGFDLGNPVQPVGEVTIFNCCFNNCSTAVCNPLDIFNNFMWHIDGCEFDNNGIGFNGNTGGCFILTNCHFSHSSVVDIQGGSSVRGHRLTSSGSAQFFNGPGSQTVLEDCWVDGWTNTNGAVLLNRVGQMSIFDCTFTTPPTGALGPIWLYEDVPWGQDILLSNNYAPNFPAGPGILHQQVDTNINWVPSGTRGGSITSSTQTFLQSATINDSTNIIDVTQSPYNAVPNNFSVDSTAAIQSAINAAKTANNGSIVYIPGGLYRINSTLSVAGGNYTIEGEGTITQLCYCGGSNGTAMTVTTPQNITLRFFAISALENLPSDGSNYNSAYPNSDSTTITGIKETSTGTSSAVYDTFTYNSFYLGNPGAAGGDLDGPGLVFSSLPAGSKVYIPVLGSPLTVQDCGPAQILVKTGYMGAVNVSGATQPKTGFLGFVMAEGGQGNTSLYNVTVNDNQNLVFGSYYTEQSANDLSLARGAGTTTGHVSIYGFNTSPTPNSYSINVNNYAGRLLYGETLMANQAGNAPVTIAQSGTNPIDFILSDIDFTYNSPPNLYLSSGANLIAMQNVYGSGALSDTPDPLTSNSLVSLAQSLDDFRQLDAVDLSLQYGITTDGPPLSLYPMENNANDMTGANKGTNHSATFVSGAVGSYAAKFNGTSTYIQIPKPTTGSFTISMWAQTTDTGATGQWYSGKGLVDGEVSGSTTDFGTALNGGKFSLGIGNPDKTLTSTVAVNDGKWHHLVATWNSSNGAMQLYVDGALNNSTTGPTALRVAPANLRIGSIQTGVSTGFLNGALDQVAIYNYVLSATDVAYLYNHTQAPRLSPVAATGYTQDVIYGPANGDTTATALFQGYHLYAAGQGSNGGTGGLPDSGVIVSPNNPNVTFQLQPYNASNVLPLQGNSGTLTLTTPAKYTDLSVLLTNAGTGGVSYTLNFSDGSHTTVNYGSLPYWVNGQPFSTGGTLCYENSFLVNDGTPVEFDEYDYTLSTTDQAKTLNSITFTGINYTNGTVGIFALSGHPK